MDWGDFEPDDFPRELHPHLPQSLPWRGDVENAELLTGLTRIFLPLDAIDHGLTARVVMHIIDANDPEAFSVLEGLRRPKSEIPADAMPIQIQLHEFANCKNYGTYWGLWIPMIAADGVLKRLLDFCTLAAPDNESALLCPVEIAPETLCDLILYELAYLRDYHRALEYENLHMPQVEALFQAYACPEDLLAHALFAVEPPGPGRTFGAAMHLINYGPDELLPGLGAYLQRFPEVGRNALSHKSEKQRVFAAKVIVSQQLPLEPYADLLARCACGSSKPARRLLEPVLRDNESLFAPPLRELVLHGKPLSVRANAATILPRLGYSGTRAFLEEALAGDPPDKVAAALQEGLARVPADTPEKQTTRKNTPATTPKPPTTSPAIALDAPMPDAQREMLREALQGFLDDLDALIATVKSGDTPRRGSIPFPEDVRKRYPDKAIATMVELVDKPLNLKDLMDSVTPYTDYDYVPGPLRAIVLEFLRQPELSLVHALRLMVLTSFIRFNRRNAYWLDRFDGRGLQAYRETHPGPIGLSDISEVFEAWGGKSDALAYLYTADPAVIPWEESAIAPYLAKHPHVFAERLGVSTGPGKRHGNWLTTLAALNMLPDPVEAVVPKLWSLALEEGKEYRPLAQACLERWPNLEPPLLQALEHQKAPVRTEAAQWIARIKLESAEPALRAALEKESDPQAKNALLAALQALGIPLHELFDRAVIEAEAKTAMAKGIPKKLEWFPFALLPELHWESTGEKVPFSLTQWFVLMSQAIKSPEPDPLLQYLFEDIREADRHAYGAFILKAWIERDTVPKHAPEEIEAEANRWLKMGYPEDEARILSNRARAEMSRPMKYSAHNDRGMLGVVAACGGDESRQLAMAFIKKWYGLRLSQSKSLVRMLSWFGDLASIHYLLAIAQRHRTAGIQKEAAILVEELAARMGWTSDELSDRTIPTAGFDADGTQVLDYGERQFTIRWTSGDTIQIKTEAGKVIKSLPAARKDEDDDLVKLAKKNLTATKKELKAVVSAYPLRLHDYMCCQRRWHFGDWDTYLNHHPIVQRLCRRLAWMVLTGAHEGTLFRPGADGVPQDVEGSPLNIPGEAEITLAHGSLLGEETRSAWRAHFPRFEITPVFPQFRIPRPELSKEERNRDTLVDYEGYLIDGVALRNLALKLGYKKGPAEEDAIYSVYLKAFPASAIEVEVGFSGNFIREEKRPVSLTATRFTTIPDPASLTQNVGRSLTLADVPSILLHEIWADLRQMAEAGSGYSPDWQAETRL